uniref:Uncharacterized protein n=1 Tax=Anopheles atroparvus TaxID=41427 RepID=A0A182J540_ANOAO
MTPTALATFGSIVLESMKIVWFLMPPPPMMVSYVLATISLFGSIVTTKSDALANSATLSLLAIGPPMLPSPMKPTFLGPLLNERINRSDSSFSCCCCWLAPRDRTRKAIFLKVTQINSIFTSTGDGTGKSNGLNGENDPDGTLFCTILACEPSSRRFELPFRCLGEVE